MMYTFWGTTHVHLFAFGLIKSMFIGCFNLAWCVFIRERALLDLSLDCLIESLHSGVGWAAQASAVIEKGYFMGFRYRIMRVHVIMQLTVPVHMEVCCHQYSLGCCLCINCCTTHSWMISFPTTYAILSHWDIFGTVWYSFMTLS